MTRLKEALISSPILAYPNYDKPFILETDTSLKGLGTVLSQEDDDGNYHVISFASHTLKPFEKVNAELQLSQIGVACTQVGCM